MRVILLILIGLSYLSGADTFVDAKTGLIWQDNIDAKTVKKDWYDAKRYCQNLILDGYNDWRLPNIKELQSIVDIKKYKPAIKKGFKNVASSRYWSSSSNVSDGSEAWRVDFYDGCTYYYYKADKYYVRCVRGSGK